MRRVVPSSEVFHLWAHQTQDSARGNGASISFSGNLAFSYAATIGEIREITTPGGGIAKWYIVAPNNWTVTTARHISDLRRAIPSYLNIIEAEPQAPATRIIETFINNLPARIVKIKRSRTYGKMLLDGLLQEIGKFQQFAHDSGVEFPFTDAPNAGLITQYCEQAQAMIDQRAEEKRIRHAEEYKKRTEENVEKLAVWLNGGKIVRYVNTEDGRAYLRVDPDDADTVETTLGARVPKVYITRAVAHIMPHVDDMEWIPSRTIQLGHYTVEGVFEGVLVVGCHKFAASEIKRFARVLGYDVPA